MARDYRAAVSAATSAPGSARPDFHYSDLLPTGPVELKAVDVVDDDAVTGYAQAHLDPLQLLIDTDVKASSLGQAFGALL